MDGQESNIDRLIKARAEIDDKLRQHKAALTILFTDVVGSTSYFERYGDTAGLVMLHRHADLASSTVAEFQGTVIKTIGDSVMAEFPEPAFAVRAAVEIQRRLLHLNQTLGERERIQLRIGINSGAVFRHGEDVYGDAVNTAARIAKRSGPAQILISRSVREAVLVEKDLRCTWLGKVTMEGKAAAEDVFEVTWTGTAAYAGLRAEVTAALARGEISAPGLNLEDLVQPGRKPTPVPADELPMSAGLTPPSGVRERYDLVSEVGSGGMGVVYKARDRDTGTMVAIKVLHPDIAGRAELIERFKTELVLARKITHKNVCRVYDLNRFDNGVAISMEYIEGESLRAVLSRVDGLSIHHGLKIVHQVIGGLAEAHSQGVIHRDLKPENILIARDGTVKVMDFGIARSVDTDATISGSITGTPAYMSPEQAAGKTIDARSDIYSLGLVMYEVFCGRQAFTGDTAIAVAMKQIQETPPPPTEAEPHLPAFLDRIILKCIEKNPAKRFQSVHELETALAAKQEATAAVAVAEGAEPPLPIHLTRWQRSDWLLPALAAIGLLLFFPFFVRTSFAPRSQVSFDRGVLRRIAQEHAQKLGAPIGSNSQIRGGGFTRYDYVAGTAGAPAALELTNNPVPYVVWRVEWENGTSVVVDHRGSLQSLYRDFPSGATIEKLSIEEAKTLAEKAVRFLDADPAVLRLETAGDDVWLGRAATEFTWSDPKDLHGLQRRYVVRLVGRDIASLEANYDVPRGYDNPPTAWQILPLLAFEVVLLVMGLFQRTFVDLYSRWRVITVSLVTVVTGASTWLVLSGVLQALRETSIVILLVVLASLAISLIAFFFLIPVERAVRRMAPAKLSTVIRLFDRRAASEPCGLGILRGTLVGLGVLGVDTFLVWVGTIYLGMRLDSTALIAMQGLLFLNNPWPSAQLVSYPLMQAFTLSILIAFLTAFLARMVRRSWLAVLLAAALAAAIFPGPLMSIGAVQPYPAKVLLLTLDFLVLAWAFTRFDVLTLFVAAFTYSFVWQNYTMFVTFRPLGSLEEWVAFAVWGLFVAAASAIAFKPAVLAACRRVAATFQ